MSCLPNDENLIFILSQPRSGSTMLQLILATHPKITTTREPWILLPFIHIRSVQAFHNYYRFRTAQNAVDDFINTFNHPEDIFLKSVALMANNFYQEAIKTQNVERFLDKTPLYYLIIPQLFTMFPNAKYIFLLRNPLAVLRSILDTWIKDEWYRLTRHKSNLLLAPRLLIDNVEHNQENIMVVHYEKLVQSPEEEIHKICDNLGISFFPELLNFSKNSISEGRMGDPTGVETYQYPNSNNINKWVTLGENSQTKYLAKRYLNFLGRDTLTKMGYDFNELTLAIDSQNTRKTRFTIKWKHFFPEKKSIFGDLRIVLLTFLQFPNPSLLERQLKNVFSERFFQQNP